MKTVYMEVSENESLVPCQENGKRQHQKLFKDLFNEPWIRQAMETDLPDSFALILLKNKMLELRLEIPGAQNRQRAIKFRPDQEGGIRKQLAEKAIFLIDQEIKKNSLVASRAAVKEIRLNDLLDSLTGGAPPSQPTITAGPYSGEDAF